MTPPLAPLLVASLLAAPTHVVGVDALSLALPPGCTVVALAQGLEAALDPQRRGAWADLLLDPRWLELAQQLGVDPSAELGPERGVELRALAASVRGAALGFEVDVAFIGDGGTGGEAPPLVAVVLAGDDFVQRVAALLPESPAWTTLTAGGLTVEALDLDGGYAVQRGDTAFVVGGPDPESRLAAALARAGEAGGSRWWLEHGARRANAQLELFVDLAGVEVPESALIQRFGAAYGAVALGAGVAGEIALHVDVVAPDVFGPLADAQLVPDLDLLGLARPGDLSASIWALDPVALVELAVDLSESVTPGARETYEGGREAARGFLGVDPVDDLLGGLTGQLLVLQHDASVEELASDTPTPGQVPTLALGHHDEDVFLDLLDTVGEFLNGAGLPVAVEDVEGATQLVVPGAALDAPELGDVAIAVGTRYLVLGTGDRVAATLERARSGATLADCPFGAQPDLRLAGAFEGSLVSASDLEATIGLLRRIGGSLADLDPNLASDPDADAFQLVWDTTCAVAGDHLSGLALFELLLDEGGVGARMFTR